MVSPSDVAKEDRASLARRRMARQPQRDFCHTKASVFDRLKEGLAAATVSSVEKLAKTFLSCLSSRKVAVRRRLSRNCGMSIIASDALSPPPVPPPLPAEAWPAPHRLARHRRRGGDRRRRRIYRLALVRESSRRLKEQSEHAYLSELQMQGREIVGFVRGFDQSPQFFDQQIKEGLTHGPYEQRLRFIILVGELEGRSRALEQLSAMRDTDWEQRPPTEDEAELTALVEKLYRTQQRQFAARIVGGGVAEVTVMLLAEENEPEENGWSLTADERRELRHKLDWFGELALTPADGSDPAARAAVLAPAKRTALTLFVLGPAVLLMIGLGFVLLAVGVLVAPRSHMLRPRFLTGSRDGGIYAETFALWMVLYLVLEIASAFIPLGSCAHAGRRSRWLGEPVHACLAGAARRQLAARASGPRLVDAGAGCLRDALGARLLSRLDAAGDSRRDGKHGHVEPFTNASPETIPSPYPYGRRIPSRKCWCMALGGNACKSFSWRRCAPRLSRRRCFVAYSIGICAKSARNGRAPERAVQRARRQFRLRRDSSPGLSRCADADGAGDWALR